MQARSALLTEEEQKALQELYNNLSTVQHNDWEAIQALLIQLDKFIATFKTRLNMTDKIEITANPHWFLVRYFLGQKKDFSELNKALDELANADSPDDHEILIKKLIDGYDYFQITNLSVRLPWEDTECLLEFTKIMKELKDENLTVIADKMKKKRISDVVAELQSSKSTHSILKSLLELNILMTGIPSNAMLLLINFILLPEDERKALLANLTADSYQKFRYRHEIPIENYLKLSNEMQIDLLSILYEQPSLTGIPLDIRDKIEKSQLVAATNELNNPTTLLRTKAKLRQSTVILAMIESRLTNNKLASAATDEHQDLLRYLSLNTRIPLIRALTGIYINLGTSSATQAIPHLKTVNDFKRSLLPDALKLSVIFAPFIYLTREQKENLGELIKNCIHQTNEIKKFAQGGSSFVKTVEFLNKLALYAKSQEVPVDYATLNKLNEKVKLLPTTVATENISHLNEKQAKLIKIRIRAIFLLISHDLFYPIFENQLAMIDGKELDKCMKGLNNKKIDEIKTRKELMQLTHEFRDIWIIANIIAFSALQKSSPLFDDIQGNLVLVRDLLKKDKYKEKFKEFENSISGKNADVLAILNTPTIQTLLTNVKTGFDIASKTETRFEVLKTNPQHSVPALAITSPQITDGQPSPIKRDHRRSTAQITPVLNKPPVKEESKPAIEEVQELKHVSEPTLLQEKSKSPTKKRDGYRRVMSESQLKFNLLKAKFEPSGDEANTKQANKPTTPKK